MGAGHDGGRRDEARDVGTDRMSGLSDAVVATIRDALVVLGPDLRVRATNPAFTRAFGVSDAAVHDRPLVGAAPGPWDHANVQDAFRDVLSGATEMRELDVAGVGPDGSDAWWRLRVRRLEAPPGGEPDLLLVVEDVTTERAATAEAEAYRIELERSNRDLQQFAYAASHDLQEPLRTIASFGSLLDRRYRNEMPEGAHEPLDFMVDAASRMQALVRDLLTFSRAGTRELRPETIALGDVLDEVIADLADALTRTGTTVTIADRPLPAVHADRGQVAHLLQNLLTNAAAYASTPDRPAHVTVSASEGPAGRVTVVVADDGPGVPEAHRERVFMLFERLHSQRHATGSGMGLPLCRRIVERHGGRIVVEDGPAGGATFRFDLPGGPS